MIKWPAIIKYPVIINFQGDDELAFIANESDWNSNAEFSKFNYEENDALIDSNGRFYRLDKMEHDRVIPEATGSTISLLQFIKLVQRHAAVMGECCIEKIIFKSLADGMNIIASTMENN